MSVVHWMGRHGPCIVGETYAEGDRRDLGLRFIQMQRELEWYARTLANRWSHDLPVDEDQSRGSDQTTG